MIRYRSGTVKTVKVFFSYSTAVEIRNIAEAFEASA